MITIDAEVEGLKELNAKMTQMGKDLHGQPMMNAMNQAAMLVTADAKRLAPVDTGRLRASITPEVRIPIGGNNVEGVVGSNVVYAPYMELGTRPHWPPPGALKVWAERHGIPEFLVMRSIAQKGTKPRRFLQDAFDKNKDRIIQMIEDAVARIVSE